jgi:uncharacterized protein YdeI (YjbR/CyaY-like superfamily)
MGLGVVYTADVSGAAMNPKVGAYVAKAAAFAQPVLTHLRGLVHKACPDVVEEMKWSRPFFLHGGVILGNMSAFKEHCSFGFWGAEMGKVLQADGVVQDGGMGSLGRITSVKDLPADKAMLEYLRQAAKFIDEGKGETFVAASRRVVKAPKAPVEMPEEFASALAKNKGAGKVFEGFSLSCKREYVEWIAEAKRAETREKRIAQAMEWIAEGKPRNWKYQKC